MKIMIENTPKIVTLIIRGQEVPARVWQGQSESGVPVQCFITRIAPEVLTTDPRADELCAEFERELRHTAAPRSTVEAIPLRVIL